MAADDSSPRKAPLNYLIGRAIHERRSALGFSPRDLQPLVGLKASYIRGIESGSTKCPTELALGLSNALKWDYGHLSMLLAAASTLDSTKKAASEPSVLMPKLAGLSEACPSFNYVWTWCAANLEVRGADLLSTSLKNQASIPRDQLTAARAVIDTLLFHLATASRMKPDAPGSQKSDVSPFFLPAISGLVDAIEGFRDTLKHATPIVSQEGIAYFDRMHRENIVSAHAFLRYRLRPEMFEKADVTWEFLRNKHRPKLHIHTPFLGEIGAKDIDTAIRNRLNAQKLMPPQDSFVVLYEDNQLFQEGFKFNLPTRSIRIGEDPEQGDLFLANAWIYELAQGVGRTHLGMLDSYREDVSSPLYGVSISPDECVRLLSILRANSETE